jgi:hypothetical protein
MALQSFYNGQGLLLGAFPNLPRFDLGASSIGAIDAVGERIAAVGHLLLSTGPGTSKTISSAGGKIYWATGPVTWADAGTSVSVGIQDVASTGIEDTTYDVSAALVPGTETITANAVNVAVMESGTKTITHGDFVAVVLTMTARGGTDSVSVFRQSLGSLPYSTLNGAKVGSNPMMTVEFDDGTVGFFDVASFAYVSEAATVFGSSSTPDEHALIFRVPVPCAAVGLYANLLSLASADDFELILYSDPLGSPVAQRTLVQDMDLSATNPNYGRPFTSAYSLTAGTDYAIALRPTTTNTLAYSRLNFGSGNSILRKATMLGTHAYLATRSDQTGAFGSADTTILPLFGVWLAQFDDGVSSGGGEHAYVFVG